MPRDFEEVLHEMTKNTTQQVKVKNEELNEKTTPMGTRLENERMKLYRRTIVKERPRKKTTKHSVNNGAIAQLEFEQQMNKEVTPQSKTKQGFKLQAQKDIEMFHKLISNDPKRGEIHL